MTHDTVSILQDLFVHRDNAYAEQWVNKSNGNAGYIKVVKQNCPTTPPCSKNECKHKSNLPLTKSVIKAHLKGDKTIGVYQLGDDDKVKWICFDVDKDKTLSKGIDPSELHDNAKRQVRLLVQSCLSLGINPAVEDSGNRGYHVWVFMEKPVLASAAQSVGHFILESVAIQAGLHIEMFPKQVSAKSLGNLVKLPLGIHLKSGKRALFVNRKFENIEDQAEFLRSVPRTTPTELQSIIDWYGLKVASIRREDSAASTGGIGRRVPLCFVRLLNEGVGDGMRDIAAFKIACYFRDKGLPQSVAMAAMQAWDENNDPPLGLSLIRAKVESAFSDTYSFLPCFDPVFDRYCSSSCEMYPMKMERKTKSTQTRTSSRPQLGVAQSVAQH